MWHFKLGGKINYLVTADGKVHNIWKNKQDIRLHVIHKNRFQMNCKINVLKKWRNKRVFDWQEEDVHNEEIIKTVELYLHAIYTSSHQKKLKKWKGIKA